MYLTLTVSWMNAFTYRYANVNPKYAWLQHTSTLQFCFYVHLGVVVVAIIYIHVQIPIYIFDVLIELRSCICTYIQQHTVVCTRLSVLWHYFVSSITPNIDEIDKRKSMSGKMKMIVMIGATGVGKSKLGIQIAKALNDPSTLPFMRGRRKLSTKRLRKLERSCGAFAVCGEAMRIISSTSTPKAWFVNSTQWQPV